MRAAFIQLCLACCLVFAGACCAWAGPATTNTDVTITPQAEGGYQITTPGYQARVGTDGNLHSLMVNGIEFLDDHTAASMGASFFVERPISLPTMRVLETELTATDGTFVARYRFDAGYLTLTLRHSNTQGAAYVAVCSPKVAYVEDLVASTVAAAPVNYHWGNAKVTVPTGEFLEFHGGSRIWGREIERQVWECSNMAPNRDYTVMIIPGRDAPPTPDLSQLTSLATTMNVPTQLVPADQPAEITVRFDNNSNQPITTEIAARIESTRGDRILEERKPLVCDPHQSTTLTWSVTPSTSDFYRFTCTVNLDGATKSLATTFGYNTPAIMPVAQCPDDFTAYWERVVAEAKAPPVHLTMLADSTRSTNTVRVYEIGIESDGFTCSGWLSVPKYPGRYPALLLLPSDRQRTISPSPALAEAGFVVMSVEPTGQSVRTALKPLITQVSSNLTNPAMFGGRAVIMRYLRAVTALSGVPEVDPSRIAVTGAGLGGGMAMLVAALDDRVQAVAPDVPYYCHIELDRDQPDWPYLEIADYLREHPEQQDAVMQTLRYFDVANFAGRITCPVFISAGIDDTYSCPKQITGVYNQLSAPKALAMYLAGHQGGGAKHWEEKVRWLVRILGGPGPALPAAPATTPAPQPADRAFERAFSTERIAAGKVGLP